MWYHFQAELWTFDPSVDPPCMEKYDQFGHWIFVYRNPHKDRINTQWRQINKERIAVDPGGKIFETVYCVGTGDVYYIGEGLGTDIREQLYHIAKLQSERDEAVNEYTVVAAALAKVNTAQTALYAKVSQLFLPFIIHPL
jgi:hypothetical protein